jgi:hypothetical protein
MDRLLIKISQSGRLEGYPLVYSPTSVTNPILRFIVFNKQNITVAKLMIVIYITARRYPWEPEENCIFIQSILNVSGYKGLGADLIRLLQAEAQRLKLPILLTAVGNKKTVHKLYDFYEQLGFVSVPDTIKLYDNAKSELQDFRFSVCESPCVHGDSCVYCGGDGHQ